MARMTATEARRQTQEDSSLKGATFPEQLDEGGLINRIRQYASGCDLAESDVYGLCTSVYSGLGKTASGDKIRSFLEPNFQENKDALDNLVIAVQKTKTFCTLVSKVCDGGLNVDSLDATERLELVTQLKQALRFRELPQSVFDAAAPVFRRVTDELSKPDVLGEIACDLLKPGAKVNINGGLKVIVSVEEADGDHLRIQMTEGRKSVVFASIVRKGTLTNIPGSDTSEANKQNLAAKIGVTPHKAGIWFGLYEMQRILDEENRCGDTRFQEKFQNCLASSYRDQGLKQKVPEVGMFVDSAVGAAVSGMLSPTEERLVERTLLHIKNDLHTDLVVLGATNQLRQSKPGYRRWMHDGHVESIPAYFTKDKGYTLRPMSAVVDNFARLKLYSEGVGVLNSAASNAPSPARSDFHFGRFTGPGSDTLLAEITILKQMGKPGSVHTEVQIQSQASKLIKPHVERLKTWLAAELGPEWQKKMVVTWVPGTTGTASNWFGKALASELLIPHLDLISREQGPSLKGRPGVKARLDGIAGKMSLYAEKFGSVPNLLIADDVLDLGVTMKIAENVAGPVLAPGGRVLTCVAAKK